VVTAVVVTASSDRNKRGTRAVHLVCASRVEAGDVLIDSRDGESRVVVLSAERAGKAMLIRLRNIETGETRDYTPPARATVMRESRRPFNATARFTSTTRRGARCPDGCACECCVPDYPDDHDDDD
jgi:hypothetical protein